MAAQDKKRCPYCTRQGLKGQAGVSGHIAKTPACQAAQEQALGAGAANPAQRFTAVLFFHLFWANNYLNAATPASLLDYIICASEPPRLFI